MYYTIIYAYEYYFHIYVYNIYILVHIYVVVPVLAFTAIVVFALTSDPPCFSVIDIPIVIPIYICIWLDIIIYKINIDINTYIHITQILCVPY